MKSAGKRSGGGGSWGCWRGRYGGGQGEWTTVGVKGSGDLKAATKEVPETSLAIPTWLTTGVEEGELAEYGPEWAKAVGKTMAAGAKVGGDGEPRWVSPLLDSQPLASYNWDTTATLPTIVIPGRPKRYNGWGGGLLQAKDEDMVKDEDTYRYPTCPIEPAFVAIRLLRPDFDLSSVDVVVDLNSLKHLARFLLYASGEVVPPLTYSEQINHEVFRMGLQNLGSLVGAPCRGPLVILRHEERFQARWLGYGAAFIRACLTGPSDAKLGGPFKQMSLIHVGSLRILLRHKVPAIRCSEEIGEEVSGPSVVEWGEHGLATSLRVERSTGAAGPGVEDGERLILGSLGLACDRLVVDKWLDMLFTGAQTLCLGRHFRGHFRRTDWLKPWDVKRLCNGGGWDELALLRRLEALLGDLVAHTRHHAPDHDLALLLLPYHRLPRLTLRRLARRDVPAASPDLVRSLIPL